MRIDRRSFYPYRSCRPMRTSAHQWLPIPRSRRGPPRRKGSDTWTRRYCLWWRTRRRPAPRSTGSPLEKETTEKRVNNWSDLDWSGTGKLKTFKRSHGQYTRVVIHLDLRAVVRHPGGYADEVSDERRDQALQDCGVSVQYVLVDHASLVELMDHWKKERSVQVKSGIRNNW